MNEKVIWSSMNGAYLALTNWEVRENGYWLNAGTFSKFVSREEALELAEAILNSEKESGR